MLYDENFATDFFIKLQRDNDLIDKPDLVHTYAEICARACDANIHAETLAEQMGVFFAFDDACIQIMHMRSFGVTGLRNEEDEIDKRYNEAVLRLHEAKEKSYQIAARKAFFENIIERKEASHETASPELVVSILERLML